MFVKKFFACDFETNNSIDNNIVYAWGIMDENKKYWYGVSMASFIERVFTNIRHLGNRKNVNFYFNNLSNFDGHFIVKWLYSKGWKQKFKTKEKNILDTPRVSIFKEGEKLKPKPKNKYFTLLATELKSILKLVLFLDGRKANFYCSLKIWNTSIKKQGELLNKTYNTDKYTKLDDFNYGKIRHFKKSTDLEKDKKTFDYLYRDCLILRTFIKEMLAINSVWHMTAGSSAYNDFLYSAFDLVYSLYKKNIQTYNVNKSIVYVYSGKTFWSKKKLVSAVIHKLLPVKWMLKHSDIRQWVAGGLTFFNESYRGVMVNGVDVIDLNSAYSAVMVEKDYPIGEPFLGDGGKKYPLKLYIVNTFTDCYNYNGLPFCYEKNTMGVKDYPTFINKNTTLYITDIEFRYFEKYYKGDYTAKVVYSFMCIKGKELFGNYVNKWFYKKINSKTASSRYCYKIFLNSLFGKFLSKNSRSSKILTPNWDETTHWEIEQTITEPRFYTPIGIWITAYNRIKLVNTVGKNYHQVIYGDTDSLIVKKDFKKPELDEKKLGAWKVEQKNISAFVLGKKKYCLAKDKKIIKTTLASFYLNKKAWDGYSFVDFWAHLTGGFFAWEQLQKIETKTGFILKEHTKKLSPIWHKRYIAGKDALFKDKESFDRHIQKTLWDNKHLY